MRNELSSEVCHDLPERLWRRSGDRYSGARHRSETAAVVSVLCRHQTPERPSERQRSSDLAQRRTLIQVVLRQPADINTEKGGEASVTVSETAGVESTKQWYATVFTKYVHWSPQQTYRLIQSHFNVSPVQNSLSCKMLRSIHVSMLCSIYVSTLCSKHINMLRSTHYIWILAIEQTLLSNATISQFVRMYWQM